MIGYLTQNYSLIHAFRTAPAWADAGRAGRSADRIFKMAPKLSGLFSARRVVAVKGGLDRPISGLTMDSRRVVPGNLFFALPGLRTDGAAFIDEAIDRGAVAVVTQKPADAAARPRSRSSRWPTPGPRSPAWRSATTSFPTATWTVVGVTGTNGKTTVTHLIKHFLNGDQRVGLIGTVNYDLGARTVPSYKTTPESLDIYGMLAQMRDAGCRQAVMEVSSHGIDQQRVLGLHFGAAVFTNLTRDHLDYHKIARRLFRGEGPALHRRHRRAAPRSPSSTSTTRTAASCWPRHAGRRCKLVTFGEHPAADGAGRGGQPRVQAHHLPARLAAAAPPTVESPLIGRYNVSNLLAALATCWALGPRPGGAPAAAARRSRACAGRMERIEEGQPFNVLVDYAHTDDALRNALGMLRADHARAACSSSSAAAATATAPSGRSWSGPCRNWPISRGPPPTTRAASRSRRSSRT